MTPPIVDEIFHALEAFSTEEKRTMLPRFFKTGKGEYGEGDQFMGVTVPCVRQVAKQHASLPLPLLPELLASKWHEMRLCALLILVLQCKKEVSQEVFNFYLAHSARINNWDLVDLSAPGIVGRYLIGKNRDVLYQLAQSPLLWDNRIAMVATYAFIKQGDLDDTYRLATMMMHHPHDLMRKATGWMLREAGKRDSDRLYRYIDSHKHEMPRTMLRYAIERFDPATRKHLMGKSSMAKGKNTHF